MPEFNPCITKRNHVWKYHLIFFLYFIIDFFFFVWEMLYESNCSTKGATQAFPKCPTINQLAVNDFTTGSNIMQKF